MKFAPKMSILASLAILAGCVSYSDSNTETVEVTALKPAAQETVPAPFYVRASMQDHINPAIMSIWEISNNAMDEVGGIDGAQVDDAGWAQLVAGAAVLETEAQKMADASNYASAAPDNMVTGEYEVTMEAVQGLLDNDPALFLILAKDFAAHSQKLGAAAKAKDAKLTGDLVADTDAICASCHAQFWYGQAG